MEPWSRHLPECVSWRSEGIESIAMFRVGAGLGGLSWKEVCAIIERIYTGWPAMIYVFEEYVPRDDHTSGGRRR